MFLISIVMIILYNIVVGKIILLFFLTVTFRHQIARKRLRIY